MSSTTRLQISTDNLEINPMPMNLATRLRVYKAQTGAKSYAVAIGRLLDIAEQAEKRNSND